MYRLSDTVEVCGAAAARPDVRRRGWRAAMSVTFRSAPNGTIMVRRGRVGPLAIQKPLYPEGRDICHALLLHPPGGLAAGDALHIDVALDSHAHAVLSTPGSTKWYKAALDAPASQHVQLTVAAGARLDWLPQDNIYFANCHARQSTVLRVADGASALGWDAGLLGRRAGGEHWTGGVIRAGMRIEDGAGRPLWDERQVLRSGDALLDAPQGLAGCPAYGTLWAAGAVCTAELAQALAPDLPYDGTVRAGATALPGGVLLVRAVAAHMEPIRLLFMRLWLRLRPIVHGVPAQPLRIWST